MNLRQKEMLQDLIAKKNNQIKELQQRIDKAIKYINSQSPYAGVSGKVIKEILIGSDKE